MATNREQVKRLFEAALVLRAEQRDAFLGALDPSLRKEVDSLLASHEEAGSFLEEPQESTTITRQLGADADTREARQIGPYRILQEIGHGGMGVVYEAEQERPVHRRVALKLIKWGMDTKAVTARFESERQALALMNHPNIASVFDAGASEQGRPYFAMELVHGEPITEYCDKNRLTIKERLELFIQACEGVQHAHQKGIIHRDIKPSNILITIQDDKPVPKIIDFGVAKATSQRLTERTVYTELGQLIGTPEYMSPEQAEMTGIDIDTRTDVYSLGVVLYELLVGTQPFDAKMLRQASFDDMRRKIREEEPPKPSTRLSRLGEPATTAAKNRRVELRSLERELRGDLDWITMKALEKDRTRRYGSPAELEADIVRHLRHEPVLASPPSTVYSTTKFVRRHMVGVTAVTAIAILLVALLVGMTVQAARIARERDRAEQEVEVASQISEFLTGLFEVSDPGEARGNTITAREIMDKGARDIEEALREQPAVQARLMATIGKVYTSLGLYSEAKPLLEQALEAQLSALGENHPDTQTSIKYLADLYWHQNRLDDAEPLYLKVVGRRVRTLGDEHPDTLRAKYDLASLYHMQGRLDEAEQLYLSTLPAQRRVLGNEHQDVAKTLHNLASVLHQKAEWDEAETLYREALAMKRKLLGNEHPSVAKSLGSLALLIHEKGDYDEAETLYHEVLAMDRKLFGDEHPDITVDINNLASLLNDKGDYDEAEALFREALAMDRKAFGDKHPNIAIGLSNLAEVLDNKGEHDAARPLHLEACRIFQESLGSDHWRLADAQSRYGACLFRLGRNEQAEELLLRAYDSLRVSLGEQHYRTRTSVRYLVEHYEAWGKPEKAAEYRAMLTKEEQK